MTAIAPPQPLSLARRMAVCAAATLFVGLTLWQVVKQRDDWPLSSFEMYSGLEGKVSSRSVVKGVSDNGEFDLIGEMLPLGGARLRHLNGKLSRDPVRQRRFVELVQQRYEQRREAKGWPALQAIRSYSESWPIRPGLVGITKPKRRVNGALYLPPSSLLERLDQERSGQVGVTLPRRLPAGDTLADFDRCGSGCEDIEDRYAAGQRALRLTASSGASAVASAELSLTEGSWSLFVRMRGDAGSGVDQLKVSLDGKRLGGKASVGNFAAALGAGAWVWASARPGERPLQVAVEQSGLHTISVKVSEGKLDVDQLWLSRAQTELPIFNDAIESR